MQTASLREHRCEGCHKLLFKGLLVEGEIDIKCKSCHRVNVIAASDSHGLVCMIAHCPQRVFATANDERHHSSSMQRHCS